MSNTKAIHSGYLDEPERIAADATVAMLDGQAYESSEGDTKARELLRLGRFAKKLRAYDRPVRIGEVAGAQEEGEETAV